MADAGKDGRRALKIKCGAVSRLRKEIGTYEKESATEAAKLEAMRAANACPHDIKQQARAHAAVLTPRPRVSYRAAQHAHRKRADACLRCV